MYGRGALRGKGQLTSEEGGLGFVFGGQSVVKQSFEWTLYE